MKRNQSGKILYKEIDKVRIAEHSDLHFYNKAILICKADLQILRARIIKNGFSSEEAEIKFFKDTKQEAYQELVYYSKLKALEVNYPKGNYLDQKAYLNNELSGLNKFFKENKEFVQ